MEKEIKVTIIVPIYNTEKYLERCIRSLINQSLEDLEIILINDGSTDNSKDIIRKYEKADGRIKVIDKNNTGVSDTRNRGIEEALGEYICFVDSDDWIEDDMISTMYQYIKIFNCEISMCTYTKEYENHSMPRLLNYKKVEVFQGEALKELHRRIIGPLGYEISNPSTLDALSIACGKLYKTSILKENNINFIDMKVIGNEDCLFNIMAINQALKVVYLNLPLYHYWKENYKSLTSTYKKDLHIKWERLYKIIKKFLEDNKKDELYYKALNNRICLSTLGLTLNECSDEGKSSLKKIKALREILSSSYITVAFKAFNLNYLPFHWRLFYFFNKYKLPVLSFAMGRTINYLRKYS